MPMVEAMDVSYMLDDDQAAERQGCWILKDDTLEVLSAGRITDITTGNLIHQVQFGHMVEVDDQMRKNTPQPLGAVPVRQQASVVLVLMLDFEGPVPYKVGSKWTLSISERGTITLKEVK